MSSSIAGLAILESGLINFILLYSPFKNLVILFTVIEHVFIEDKTINNKDRQII